MAAQLRVQLAVQRNRSQACGRFEIPRESPRDRDLARDSSSCNNGQPSYRHRGLTVLALWNSCLLRDSTVRQLSYSMAFFL